MYKPYEVEQLFTSRIYITDHQHGDTSDGMIEISPLKKDN
jgi:hypothetical protein